MFRRVLVGDNERVLVIRKKRLADILGPGEYWLSTWNVTLETYSVKTLMFQGDWTETIVNLRGDLAERYFTVVATTSTQMAVIYVAGKPNSVMGPSGRMLFWKGASPVTFEMIDVA